jgi:alpha-beta hydrolase superfamily lysophospholipase
MYSRSEGDFKGYDDLPLFYQAWEKPQPCGTIIITHGQAEHSECYKLLIEGLSDLNWSFFAPDLRGHGRSEGKRGFATDFGEYVNDYLIFVKKISQLSQVQGKPILALGHSMGGLIQLKAQIDSRDLPFKAQVLSSPLMGVGVEVPKIKDVAARLMNSILPRLTLGNEIQHHQLSRDPEVLKQLGQDPLRHDQISSGVYLGFLNAIQVVMAQASAIQIPTLLQQAGDDTVVSPKASRELFDRLGSKTKRWFEYDGYKHEIYNEIGREKVYKDLKEFLATYA